MKTIIRKTSVLMVMFSGMFIFLGNVVASIFGLEIGSFGYWLLQFAGAALLVVLLFTKRLQVY